MYAVQKALEKNHGNIYHDNENTKHLLSQIGKVYALKMNN